MSDERQFVDSNIWLYAFIQRPDEDKRHEQARNLIRRSSGITVSEQVSAEVSVNLLKKGKLPELQLGRIIEAFYLRYRVLALRDRSRVVPRSDSACVFHAACEVKMQALRNRVESLESM